MTDGPIVVKISIQRGQKKSFRGKQIITERLLQMIDSESTKEAAMQYFSDIWDKCHPVAESKLKLVKEQ